MNTKTLMAAGCAMLALAAATGAEARTAMTARVVSVSYGAKQALKNVSIDISQENVTAFIGASGCGKSAFLHCFNRMNETVDSARVGMVFQKPNPAEPRTKDYITGRYG